MGERAAITSLFLRQEQHRPLHRPSRHLAARCPTVSSPREHVLPMFSPPEEHVLPTQEILFPYQENVFPNQENVFSFGHGLHSPPPCS
ncbi:unnamed protein product [Gadus morhua 'NCC']